MAAANSLLFCAIQVATVVKAWRHRPQLMRVRMIAACPADAPGEGFNLSFEVAHLLFSRGNGNPPRKGQSQ